MTVTFTPPSFNALLSGATTKADWIAKVKAGLTSSFRVRAFRDAAANAADPATTGTEFLNITSTGGLTSSTGKIVSLGNFISSSIHQAADLLTGTSVLRIEGNGNVAQFSLGLTREAQTALGVASANLKDYDICFGAQPTATNGVALASSFTWYAPEMLNSGVGPGAPDLHDEAVIAYQIFTFPIDDTEANRVGLGVHYIDVREPNLVFDQPAVATQIGDVRYMREAAGAGTVMGTGGDCYRFAPTSLLFDKSLNATDSTKPVQRIRFLATPHGRWPNYPYQGGLNLASDTLSPQAFKIELYKKNLVVKDVIEMYSTRVNGVPGSGKPINGRSQQMEAQFQPEGTTQKVQAWWTCQMSLSWQSDEIKPSKYLNHLHPGVVDTSLDESHVKWFDAGPDQWPIITGNFLANGLHSIRVAPKWARAADTGCDTTILDPVFVNILRNRGTTQFVGYGYEPGSTGQHTWYMSPGGSRHDRGMWPHYTVAWLTAPNGVRVHGAVPYKTMQQNWLWNYHNEGCKYPTNPELGTTLDKDDIKNGRVCYQDAYYGDHDFRPDMPNHAIRLLTSGNSVHGHTIRDKNGRIMTGEYQRDDQHNISSAAQMTYFGNDPMGAFEARDTFNSAVLCNWDRTQGFNVADFLTRQHAWFFKQYPEMWFIGNNHRNGFSSAEIEELTLKHLHWMVDVVEPYLANATTVQARATRDLGLWCEPLSSDSIYSYDSKAYYFGLPLMFAKQTGFLDRIRSLSSKASRGIDLIVNGLCKGSVDFFLDGDGRPDKRQNMDIHYDVNNPPTSFNWGMCATDGQTNWIRNASGNLASMDGSPDYIEGYNTQHYRAQFINILKYFLTEYNYPRTDLAKTKVDAWYAEVEAARVQNGQNWHYMFAMMARVKPPAVVGAPVIQ